ncbi:sigma-70 family RNA polymerase sigma factor [Arthrobacter agilis]|uniref:sigma-70 family RNA polymerase sigma factor n=1 Tax=Arthrobacter agilis TaxID=37921 RepID=UPI000B3600D9|nr:sigma-70 family RNA polymerase sigma factor [Arthrobacter agilis]OUM45058.1 flagellar biosynthesis protein FliA [Arthrobacter agilis]PPB46876.1 flagellar biosynthesis protein FliA [Arthrobacter agilis]TPV23533.1 sigma-70 family RNA polymerase sigma factor [Arthrobacter agilis]WDF34667.1 sigma-70 family RNA polymerase sigma factor [Arthrobacter agilis]VDR31932.1 Sigma-F factor [Arthrobacter agilis]
MHSRDREKLIVDNLPLVGYLVSALCARATHLSRDDMASVGAIALVTSADSFDSSLGVPFGAYARRRITGAFADEMRSQDWAPRSVRRRIGDTLAAQDALAASLGRRPSTDELASTLGISRQEVQTALDDAARSVHTLDEMVLDFVPSADQLPEASILAEEQIRHLRVAVKHLPLRMRHIIEQVFFEGRSVSEVAADLGITHSAVSQQKSEALKMLQEGMTTHYGDAAAARPATPAKASPKRRADYLSALGSALSPLRLHTPGSAVPQAAFASAC